MNLFNEENKVYVIDTSGLIRLDMTFKRDNPVFTAIWEEIEDLIRNDRFKTIDFVEEEVNNYEGKETFLKNWIKKWKKHLVVETDTASINESIPITNDEYNSGFFDAKKQAEGNKAKLEAKILMVLQQIEEGIAQDNQPDDEPPRPIRSEEIKERIAAINRENLSKEEQKSVKMPT